MMKQQHRRGFTIIEILVSLALTLFILTILTQAFVAGADTFRSLKAIGDMNASLRTATTILRSDLTADHFDGKRRLSDSKFWTGANNGSPQMGYFYLEHGIPWNVANPTLPKDPEGEEVDADNLLSRRRTSHKLAFTVKARGNRPQDFFSVGIGGALLATKDIAINGDGRFQRGGTLSSQWVEVCYFLERIPNATAAGTPLFALFRQQRLVVTGTTQDLDKLNWGADRIPAGPANANVTIYQPRFSCQIGTVDNSFLYFNSAADLTIPERRTAALFPSVAQRATGNWPQFVPLKDVTGNWTGEDLLLTDVLSFDVKVMTARPAGLAATPTDIDFGDLEAPYYFDTYSRRVDDKYNYADPAVTPIPNVPTSLRLLAVQITLRVFDVKLQMARQITIVQEL